MDAIMTQQQKLKEVVEATGGCFHKIEHNEHGKYCVNCKLPLIALINEIPINPSPSDLNALFDLAEKLGLPDPDFISGFGTKNVELVDEYQRKFVGTGDTPAEALLNALHESIKDKS